MHIMKPRKKQMDVGKRCGSGIERWPSLRESGCKRRQLMCCDEAKNRLLTRESCSSTCCILRLFEPGRQFVHEA